MAGLLDWADRSRIRLWLVLCEAAGLVLAVILGLLWLIDYKDNPADMLAALVVLEVLSAVTSLADIIVLYLSLP
jgi:hypothetical protein